MGRTRIVLPARVGFSELLCLSIPINGTLHDKPVDNLAAETMVLTKTPAGWRVRTIHWSSERARAGEGG